MSLWNGRARSGWFLAIALAMACLLSAGFLIKHKAFAFADVGSDTFFCYYPLQLAVARQLQTLHEISWSFDLGLGGYIGTLFDPLWLLTGWLPEGWQLSLRLPMFMLRLLLAGGFFHGYLRQVGFDARLATLGGLGYAFSSYGVISSQWDLAHGTEFVQLPALLFLLERYLRSGDNWTAVAAGVVAGIGHPLALYMLSLLASSYIGVRLVLLPGRAATLRSLAFFALWSVVGVALTAPLLFPALFYFLENPRVTGAHSQFDVLGSLLTLNDRKTIAFEIAGFVGKDLLGTGSQHVGWSNYFEGPGFYVGLLPLVCIAQLCGPHASVRERRLLMLGLGGIALYLVWPPLRYAVYGFGHIVFRFSTVWISAVLLTLGLTGFRRAQRSGWWLRGIAAAAAAVTAIVLCATLGTPATVNFQHVIRVTAFTALYAALATFSASAGGRSWYSVHLFIALYACELLLFAMPPLLDRDAVNSDGSSTAGRYEDGTRAALSAVRQLDSRGDFYRIDKTYRSVYLDDPLAQDYPGTSSYYFHAGSLTRFVDRMALPRDNTSPNYISSMTARASVLDLLAVRYVLTRKRSLDGSGMTYVATVGDVDIYHNGAAHSFATFYDAVLSESEADALPVQQRDTLLLGTTIVEDRTAVEARLASLRATTAPLDVHRNAHVSLLRDDQIFGKVDTPSASLLLLAMPFDIGWEAWLDGEAIGLFRADYGLTALLVPPGSHQLALRYSPPWRALGFSLMAGAIAFLVAFDLFPGAPGSKLRGLFGFLRRRPLRMRHTLHDRGSVHP